MDISIENCFDSHEVGEMQSMDETRLVASSLETLGESAVNPDVGQLGGDGVLTEGVKAERTHGQTNESGNSTEEAEDDDGDANDTDDSDSLSLNYELQQGYRILKELMAESNKSVNWPFIYKVDDSYPETSDYYKKIKNPIWLEKMKDKFAKREYETITQFIADFRLMLENCYRYNGPDHYVSKRGQKLETMMEQKLALLSREIREKTSIAATSGQHQREGSPFSGLRRRTRNIIPHDSTALLNQLREEEAQSLRDARKQQMLERKAAQEAYLQDLMGWESSMMDNKDKEMRAMWELPQIGLFLFLCQEPLNTGEISQFELERCFFMPRESSTMHLVMTSLLSTPFQRTRIDHKSLMSYRVWEEKLRVKLILWYKVFTDFNKDVDKAAEKLGLDPYFFQVVGKKNPLEKKKFHEIGVYKRIWIVKSLCEWCLEHQESIRDTIEAQPVEESRCYLLGTDAKGNSYIHFPQFCGADLRIYKQAALPDPTDFFEELIEKHAEVEKPPIVPFKTPIKEKIIKKTPSSKKPKKRKLKQSEIVTPPTNRPSRLRQKIKTVLPVVNDSSSSSSSDEEEDTAADDDGDDTVTEEQSDSAFNDSGISENTPAKRKRIHMNKRISKVLESELYSDSSSVDSENSAWRRRSSRLLKNGLMKEFKTIPFDIDLDETSCDKFDSISENGLGMSEESRTDGKNIQEERTKNNSTPLSDATEFSFNNSESGDEIKTQNSISVDSKKSPKDANSKDDGAGDKSDCEKYTFASCSTVDAKGDKVVDYKKLCDAIDSVMSNGLYGDSDDETSKDSSIGFSIDENAMNSDMEAQNKNGIADTDGLTNTDQFSIDIIKKENCDLDSNVLENKDSPMENNVCDRTDKENHDNSNVSCNSERTQNHSLVKPENPSCDSNSSVCNDSNLNLSTSENPLSEKDKNVLDLHSKEMHEAESNENIKIKQEPIDDHEMQKDARDGKEILSDFVKEPSGSQENIKSEKKKGKILDVRDENNDIINQDIDIKTEIKSPESMEVEEVINHDKKPKDESEEGNEKNEDTKLSGNKSMKKENDMETGSCEVKKENETESETTKADEEEMKERKEESEDEEEELFPEIGAFELIVRDVEGLRKLVEEFAEPEPVVIGSGKKQKVIKPPPRRKCVKELYERLLFLLKELEPWESKLLQATKKARIKLRKEHEEYKDSPQEENDDFWKTDNSDTDTDEGSGDDSDDEMSETDKSKSSTVKTGETPQITTAGDQESYEMDVSSRGRLRKRRVIPNNVEDQSKKRKVINATVTTASEHIPNILQRQSKTGQGSSLVTNLDQLKVLNIGGGIGLNSAGQILLQSTNTGSHALVTGLTPQAIASLRLGTKGTVIVPSTQQMKTPQKSQTQARLMSMSSKQASHPVIQGLLSTRQPNILQKSGTNKTGAATLANQTGTTGTPINVLGVNQTVTPDSPQKQNLAVKTTTNSNQQNKVQYYAANLNSLPPAVLQQLVKSNSLKLQPGTNQSAMVLLAVNPQTSSGVSKVSTAQVIIRNTTTESQGIVSSVSIPSEGKNTTLLCAQNVDLLSQQHTQLKTATTIPTTADIENPSILSGISTVKLESSDSFTSNQSVTLNQQLSASGVLKSVVSSLAASQQQQNLSVITTSLPSPTLQSGSDSIVTNAMSNLSGGTILTSSLGPLSPNRSVNKYSGSVTVKSLLEARKDAMRIEAQRQIAMKRVPTVVSTVQSPQLPATPLRVGGVQPVSMPSVVGKRSTVVLHPTTSGIKALKLPSKAVLDSAVQAVVTSVVTSLPTANIKVPSPVTMPSIQRRKNVTKTIMSMKAPIPTTPKVETKSLEVSCASVSSVGNSPIVTTTSSNNQTILTQIPSGNNQYIMANVKKNSVGGFITNSYTVQGQNPKNLMLKLLPQNMAATSQSGGVLQGYLTPQGIVISQAGTTNPTTPQKSATLVSDGMQVINQNFQNPASTQINLLPNQVTACTFSMATSSTPSNSQTTTVSVTSANAPNKQVAITLKPGNLPGTGTFTTNSSAKGIVVTNSTVNSKMSATKSGTINMASAVTQIDFKSAPISSSTVQSSTKKDVAPVIVSNGSLMVNNIVGSRLPGINISGQNLSATVPQIANINHVPQSPVQLTSPVIGQVANPIGNYVPAAVLGQLASPTGKVNLGQLTGLAISPNLQIASQQTLPVVSGNQLIGQPSLHVVGQPIPNVAHILNQAGIPLTNASQVLSQNVFTVVSTPQVTSQSVGSTPNSISSISQVQPSVEQPTGLSLSTVKSSPMNLVSNNSSMPIVGQQFGNIATPLLSPALKQPPVVMGSFGPGSSSELMKQLAAAQILGNSQVQLAGLKPQNSVQTNLSALSGNVPCSVTASTPSQYYIQIPAAGSGAAAGQNVVRVQGQEPGQGQPMLLMSPQRGIMQGNAQLTAPTKPLTLQPGTPQTVMNVSTGSNLNQGQKQVQGQVTIPKVQLNFDVKPLVTIVPNSTNSTTSVVSSQGLPVVSSNAAGFTVFKNKVFISPSKLSTEAAELKTVDTKVAGIRPTLVAKPANKQQQQQPQQQQQQAGTQQGQKLILYNIGGNLVTPQGVQVTVENGVLKVVPKSKINIECLTTNSQTEQGALVSTGSSQLQTLPSGLINITQNIGTSSLAAAGAASQILTNSTILAPQQDQHSIQQSSSKHSEQKQTSCEISSVKHGNLVQTETSQNPYMQDISVKVSLCDNSSASALNVTSKSVENQGTKRLSTDTPEQEPNVISPKISKVQPVPSHLSGSHLKISQILAQKSTVMAVPKPGSGIVRMNVPGGTPVSPPMGSTTRNPGFVVVPGQTQVIFPHSNLSGASTAAAAKQLNVLSSHTGKVVPLQADVNIPSINSQTAPNIITSTQIYNSANPLIDINSSIASNSTSDQLLTCNSTNIKSEASKNMASVTDTVQEDGPETVAMVTGSASNNQEATGEQEAALNLLSLANQGFGT